MRKSRHLTVAAVVAVVLTSTACLPSVSWSLGATHGVVVEAGAARAGLNVYRAPRQALWDVYKAVGINGVQDALWAFGKPPRFGVCVNGVCVTTDHVENKIHGWIYGDDNDLRGALTDAQKEHNCLSLTVISRGAYIKNWTRKNVGCYTGSLSRPASTRSLPDGTSVDVVEGEEPLLPNGTTEATPADDYIPVDYYQTAP